MVWLAALLLVAGLALTSAAALARSGGSFGGGFGHSSSHSSSSSSFSFGSGHSHSSTTMGDVGSWLMLGLFLAYAVAWLWGKFLDDVRVTLDRAGTYARPSEPVLECDATLLQFGVRARARAMQDRWENLALCIDARDVAARAQTLRALAKELLVNQEDIEFIAIQSLLNLAGAQAQDQFELWGQAERAKRDRDGVRRQEGQSQGGEFFVVSLILVARPWRPPPYLRDGVGLQKLLEQLAIFATDDYVALEVVWSPDQQRDTLSRDDLGTRYPCLHSI